MSLPELSFLLDSFIANACSSPCRNLLLRTQIQTTQLALLVSWSHGHGYRFFAEACVKNVLVQAAGTSRGEESNPRPLDVPRPRVLRHLDK